MKRNSPLSVGGGGEEERRDVLMNGDRLTNVFLPVRESTRDTTYEVSPGFPARRGCLYTQEEETRPWPAGQA